MAPLSGAFRACAAAAASREEKEEVAPLLTTRGPSGPRCELPRPHEASRGRCLPPPWRQRMPRLPSASLHDARARRLLLHRLGPLPGPARRRLEVPGEVLRRVGPHVLPLDRHQDVHDLLERRAVLRVVVPAVCGKGRGKGRGSGGGRGGVGTVAWEGCRMHCA